jgi:precorrin-4/cobalt-precorrin-4 C11-methyltransferase
MDLLRRADVLIYAGSLVNPALVEESGADVRLDSWGMTLTEIVDAIEEHIRAGKLVVRLHSGDPALYGAIVEQMAELSRRGIEAEIVPGVSSLFAAAAALQTQFTLRDVSESLIVTRPAGATLAEDRIAEFSRLGQTMVVFLGTERMEEILARVECPPGTPRRPEDRRGARRRSRPLRPGGLSGGVCRLQSDRRPDVGRDCCPGDRPAPDG